MNSGGKLAIFIDGIKKHKTYKKYKNIRLVLMVGETKVNRRAFVKSKDQKPRVYLWDSTYESYYSSLMGTVGQNALFTIYWQRQAFDLSRENR